MLPRVPNAQHARANPPSRRWNPCKFVTGGDIAHYLQQEVVIEGVLHVSAAQAGTCMERFGDIDALPAPALPPLEEILAAKTAGHPSSSVSSSSTGSAFATAAAGKAPAGQTSAQTRNSASVTRTGSADRVMSEAFCLATPPDNPAESNSPLRQQPQPSAPRTNTNNTAVRNSSSGSGAQSSAPESLPERLRLNPTLNLMRAQLRSGLNPGRSVLGLEAEELLQLEGAAVTYQYTCARAAYALHTSEVLQASAAVRRQRRRALMRLLRESRALTASGVAALQESPPGQLLANIGATISTIVSYDDDEGLSPKADDGLPSQAGEGLSPKADSTISTGSGQSCGEAFTDCDGVKSDGSIDSY